MLVWGMPAPKWEIGAIHFHPSTPIYISPLNITSPKLQIGAQQNVAKPPQFAVSLKQLYESSFRTETVHPQTLSTSCEPGRPLEVCTSTTLRGRFQLLKFLAPSKKTRDAIIGVLLEKNSNWKIEPIKTIAFYFYSN